MATSQPLASEAGLQAIRDGGNAVDAALAAAIALTVVEPCSNGLGSDAFAIVWDGHELIGINGSGRSPMNWNPARFAGRNAMPSTGWDSVTVPGAASVWRALSARFGKLPFASLFGAAIRYADQGFPVGPVTAQAWAMAAQKFQGFAGFCDHFLPEGQCPRAGDIFRNPELAQTLALIANSNGLEFYEGSLARALVKQSDLEGGTLTMEDLAQHKAEWVQPLSQEYGDIALHEIPPNGQGLAAQIALAILEHLDTRSMEPESLDWTHLQIEAMKVGIHAAFEHLADAEHMRVFPEELLDPASIRRAATRISRTSRSMPPISLPVSHDTVCLAAGDETGCMASFIQSNYMGFGSGVVIRNTGIALQNRGAGFVLTPGHANQVGGNKRPFHTIIPGFVTRKGQPSLAFGLMGGHMQHQGHLQMVTRIYDHGQDPQTASNAPRWHVAPDMSIILERGYRGEVAEDLASRGHAVRFSRNSSLFGGAQLVYRTSQSYCAASDHRKEGNAVGF